MAALVGVAFAFPPSFLSSPPEDPPSARPQTSAPPSEPAPTPTPTPDEDAMEARLAITGDTGMRNAAVETTAKRMQIEAESEGGPYDALVILGDMIYPNGDSALTHQSITKPFAGVLEDAELVPVLGNHDVESGEQNEIMSKLGRDSAWYVEKFGPVRVIVLDSNRVGNQQQMAWLRQVLAEKQPADTWTIATMHHPAYSAGEHGSDKNVQRHWVPLFEQAEVPLVLAGHDHDYQRSKELDGITYVISGGGSKLRDTGRRDFTAMSASILHYLDLKVYDDRIEGRAIDHDGETFDSFAIRR